MQFTLLKSKIHRARVSDANLHYEGSIGIDRNWMDAVGLLPYEQVDVAVIDNGNRFTTYVIECERGSEEIVINGAAAHLCGKDDLVIIMGYGAFDPNEVTGHKPKILRLNPAK